MMCGAAPFLGRRASPVAPSRPGPPGAVHPSTPGTTAQGRADATDMWKKEAFKSYVQQKSIKDIDPGFLKNPSFLGARILY